MDIIHAIKKDHEQILNLFHALESSGDQPLKKRLLMYEEACTILNLHTLAEEEVIYKPLVNFQHLKNQILEGYEEHELAQKLTEEIQFTDPQSEIWFPKLKVLVENLQHHMREEESVLLRNLEQEYSSEDLRILGKEFLRAKENYDSCLGDELLIRA